MMDLGNCKDGLVNFMFLKVITPFVSYNGVPLTAEERTFNRRLSSCRIMIENMILGVTGLWRRFQVSVVTNS